MYSSWAHCPYCGMQFFNLEGDQIANHVIACGLEKQKQMHPEVLDLDQLEMIVDNDPGDEDPTPHK